MGIKNPFRLISGLVMIGVGIATGNPMLALTGFAAVTTSQIGLPERHNREVSNPLSTNEHIPVVYGSVSGMGLKIADRRVDTASNDDRALYIAGVACMGSRDGAPNDGAISAINTIYFDHVLAIDGSDNVQHDFIARKDSGTRPVGTETFPEVNTVRHLGRFLGSTTQAVDSQFNTTFPSEYPTTSRARGIAYLALVLFFNKNVYNLGQPPNITADIDGRVVWDPRLGASSSGANWAHSDNPALCLLDYLLDDVVGAGLSEADIDTDSFETIADYCDTSVAAPIIGDTNRTTARFRCNGVLDTSRPVQQNIAELLTSMGTTSELVYQGGVYRLVVRRNVGTSGFGTIALDHDNIQGEPEFNVRLPGIDSRFNRVTASFVEGSLQPPRVLTETWPVPGSNTHLTADNDVLSELTIELPFCAHEYSYHQARDTARIALRESREGITSSLVVDESGLTLEVGDVVLVTHDTPGWSAKAFWVRGVFIDCPTEEGDENHIRLILQEYQSTVYDYSSQDAEPDWPDTSHVDEKDIAAPTSLAATSDYLDEGDGTVINRVNVTWTKAASLFLKHTEIQAKKSTASTWVTVDTVAEDDDQETTFDAHTFGVKGDDVDVRARSVTLRDFVSDWASTVTVTIGGKTTGPAAPANVSVEQLENGDWFVDWDAPSESDISHWAIRDGTVWATANVLPGGEFFTTTEYRLPLSKQTKRSYQFMIAPYNRSGIQGSTHTTTPQSAGGPDASQLTIATQSKSDTITVSLDDWENAGADEYYLYASDTTGFTPSDANLQTQVAIRLQIPGTGPGVRIMSFPADPSWSDGDTIYMKVGLADELTRPLGESLDFTSEFSQALNGVTGGASPGDPTNAPTSGGLVGSIEGDLSRYYTLSWSYTQGTLPAQSFIIYRKEGSTAPTGLDSEIFAEIPATARSYKFRNLLHSVATSFGIAAARRAGDTLYTSAIHAPAGWVNIASVTLNIGVSDGIDITDDMHINNGGSGAIKYGTASSGGESSREITKGFSDFIPSSDGQTYNISGNGYLNNLGVNGGSDSVAVYTTAHLPPGVTLTGVSLNLYRDDAQASAAYEINVLNSSGTVLATASGSHGGTGGWGTFSETFNETIGSATQVVILVTLTNEASFQDQVRLRWAVIDYDRTNIEHAY